MWKANLQRLPKIKKRIIRVAPLDFSLPKPISHGKISDDVERGERRPSRAQRVTFQFITVSCYWAQK